MDNTARIPLTQRLAIEKQLLREEKFIVEALKKVKAERFALQREGTDLLCRLKELLRHRKSSNNDKNRATEGRIETTIEDVPIPSEHQSFLAEFQVPEPALDEGANEVELNLTVPSHTFYNQEPVEEFEELDTEDDFEIEMSMLMQGSDRAN